MGNRLKAIIVDDEESARNVLSGLLTRFCPEVEVIEMCTNVTNAVQSIKKHNPDVVFLDIEMPNYAGYEIVSFFEDINFDIVFVTAYNNYAVKAFEVSAVDYLLKPVEIGRLKEAVTRLTERQHLKAAQRSYKTLTENLKEDKVSKIVVRANGSQKVVSTKEIIAIEAKEAYSYIYTATGSYLMSKNLKHFETILEGNSDFFRTHKSWIVNLSALSSFSSAKMEIYLESDIIAKLSKYRKPEFDKLILEKD